MDRIVLIGRPGSGKSTLARRLGSLLDLPVFHLDRLFWRPGWEKMPRWEFARAQMRIMQENDRWIMDGNYTSTLPLRLARCDAVIYLQPPRHLCLVRVMRRALCSWWADEPRGDMAAGCRENPFRRDFLAFLLYIHHFPVAGRIDKMLRGLDDDVSVFRVASSRGAEQLLCELSPDHSSAHPGRDGP